MESTIKIKTALISVYHKDGLDELVKMMHNNGINIISTGGTQAFIEALGVPVTAVEELTSYPSILGGRVKTLHPKVFGGILGRRNLSDDVAQLEEYEIPPIDLVIVDLYPFEETVASQASEADIIEKIDIGGVSLIRAAAKNFNHVLIIPSRTQYSFLQEVLETGIGATTLTQRKEMAGEAFKLTALYDSAIYYYFKPQQNAFTIHPVEGLTPLRYGENPHQQGKFFGKIEEVFDQLHGKELSYNNLLDVESALNLIADFDETTFAVLKHNNACGVASRPVLSEAYSDALAGDPVSAFGGVLVTNQPIDKATAELMNELFFEILLAPEFDADALEILQSKKNRILLKTKPTVPVRRTYRSLLNGILEQDKDLHTETAADMKAVTTAKPSAAQLQDLVFANKLVKHTKSNAIVLVRKGQMIGSGTGQTSRIDALRQALDKAKSFGFDAKGSVMASDAFFPFPDCVEIAHENGIVAVVQPGGSIRDKESIEFCDSHQMAMVCTGIRHFRH